MRGAHRKHLRRIAVMLPYPLPAPFDYRVPADLDPQPGDVVLVPLNRREEVGVVWDAPADAAVPDGKLKPVAAILDAPPMPEAVRRFVDWVAAYTLSPPGEVMATALRVVERQPPIAPVGWSLAHPRPDCRLTEARKRVVDVLQAAGPRSTTELARAARVGSGVIRGMADAGLLLATPLPARSAFARPDPDHPGPVLSAEQEAAAAALREAVARRDFSVTLLDGVTGSGKTEVYLDAVAECLRQGRQSLVLLPEIALSSQWLERFERRFGVAPAVWHSDLSSRIRRITWRAVALGEAPVVVGARSALFLPFPDLGLVVVDEEHETAFKQEEGVVYHARDMAVVRARLSGAPAILVSATPSLETVANVRRAGTGTSRSGTAWRSVAAERRGDRPARDAAGARPLHRAAADRGGGGDARARRAGDAVPEPPGLRPADALPRIADTGCTARTARPGWSSIAPPSTAMPPLRPRDADPDRMPRLRRGPQPGACRPGGGAHHRGGGGPVSRSAAAGHGERHHAGPARGGRGGPRDRRRARWTSSSAPRSSPRGGIFPHLTLVGVVDADLGLAGGDLRAAERTVQLLHQVAGRAGRAEAPGRVLLQTFSPGPSGHAGAGARATSRTSWREEAEERRPGHWPPFGRLAALIVSADHRRASRRARARSWPRRTAGRGDHRARPGAGAACAPARPAPPAAAAEDQAGYRGAADPARLAAGRPRAARGAGRCRRRSGFISVGECLLAAARSRLARIRPTAALTALRSCCAPRTPMLDGRTPVFSTFFR